MKIIKENLTLRSLQDNRNDYEYIFAWCQNKDVYEWFEQRILTYEEIVAKYKAKLESEKQTILIIECDGKPIGLMQFYRFENDEDIPNLDKYKDVYEYDLFIGDVSKLSCGIGGKVIEMLNEYLFDNLFADAIILRPFKRNERAIKCYEKAGFHFIWEYIGLDTLGNAEEYAVLLKQKN